MRGFKNQKFFADRCHSTLSAVPAVLVLTANLYGSVSGREFSAWQYAESRLRFDRYPALLSPSMRR
jgi:hypothetical protein